MPRKLAPWLIAVVPLVVGCASAPRPDPVLVATPPEPAAAREAMPHRHARTSADLEQIRTAYFEGVRAYVREDFVAARTQFDRCLAPPDADRPEAERHEIDVLASKAEYFLGKLEEIDQAEARPEPSGTADKPAAEWVLNYGPVEPVHNEDVERWLTYFTSPDGRITYQRWLDRQAKFQPIIDEVLAEYGLPRELTYHAMIESGYSTSAYSWAHAVGLWQFIRSTGKVFGLRSDWWVDERRDPTKSTHAAAKYLAALYDEFGDWELALAAYNVGEARIRKQIREQDTRSFWDLKLPRETRNHVPKFYAAVLLGRDAESHGFTRRPPERTDAETIEIDVSVDFEVLGDCCGVSPATLAELNPALVRRATPPDEKGYRILVPAGTGRKALAALDKLPAEQRVRWAHHRVRRGDTLSEIAEQYRTSVYAIAEANSMSSVNRLRLGEELLIPQGRTTAGKPPKVFASAGPTTSRKLTYTVRPGDTLSEIAEKHDTSSSRIRDWNKLGRYLHPGQKLTIWQGKKGSAPSPQVVSVRKGDTLWEIAKRHGVSLTSLLKANNLNSKSMIRPGDRIRVPRS